MTGLVMLIHCIRWVGNALAAENWGAHGAGAWVQCMPDVGQVAGAAGSDNSPDGKHYCHSYSMEVLMDALHVTAVKLWFMKT